MSGSQKAQVERVVSAGGVVYRRSPQGPEVVVCGRAGDGVWGLPKGAPGPGETLEETAVREVREETGLAVKAEEKIDAIRYWFSRPGVRYNKTVHHYLLRPVGGNIEEHDHEYDYVLWLPVEEACRRLSYPNEVAIVRRAAELVGAGHPGPVRGKKA